MASYEFDADVNKVIKQLADKKGCTNEEAANYLLTKGIQKYNAEHKYIAAQAKADKPAKKAAPKKAAKAKGPIARKGGGKKAKAPKAAGGAEVAL